MPNDPAAYDWFSVKRIRKLKGFSMSIPSAPTRMRRDASGKWTSRAFLLAALIGASALAFAQVDAPTESGLVRTAETYHLLLKSRVEAERLANEIRSTPREQQLAKFMEAARRSSIDSSSAKLGGALGKVYQGEMVRDFENAVFSSAVHQVVGPFKSVFGWHLSYVERFGTESVAGICAASLHKSVGIATETDRQGLRLAQDPFGEPGFASKVLALLGPAWSGPASDQRGGMVFMHVPDGLKGSSIQLVHQHTELPEGQLVVSPLPKACSRSERTVWAVNCQTSRLALYSVVRYEGRAAKGRSFPLHEVSAAKATFNPIAADTFGAQLQRLACE